MRIAPEFGNHVSTSISAQGIGGGLKGKRKIGASSYIGQLRGARDPYARLSNLRIELPAAALPGLVRWFPNLAAREPLLIQGRFPRSESGILPTRIVLKPVSLEREAIWAGYFLAGHATALNSFLQLRRRLDPLLLNATYEECNSILEEIERTVSYSMWSMELRLALLSIWKGSEGQTTYTAKILNSNASNLASYIVSQISLRNEESADPFRFRSSFHATVNSWAVHPSFKAYLLYRIADDWQNGAGTVSSILRLEAISPVIDYYETFVRLATRTIASCSALSSYFREPIKLLLGVVHDSRLERLLTFLDANIQRLSGFPLPVEFVHSASHVAEGLYHDALNDIRQMALYERDEATLRIAARCCAETGENLPADNSLFGRLLPLYSRLITKDTGLDAPYTELMQFAANFRFGTFSAGLQEFANRQISSSPSSDCTAVCTRFLSAPHLDVEALPCLPDVLQLPFAQFISGVFPGEIGMTSQLSKVNLPHEQFAIPQRASNELRAEIEMELAFRRGDDSRVATLAERAYTLTSVSCGRSAARLHSHSLLRLDHLESAIDLIVEFCLGDIGSVRMFPLPECIDRMTKAFRRQFAAKLSMPILLDLFARHIDDRQRELREFTYEDFLLAHSLSRPSELEALKNKLDPRQLIYYLRFVCVPEVMQVSPTFQNSQSLEDERLAVCSLLAVLDKPNAKIYEREIDEITRRQLIQRGVRQVEQSKISIDLEPLRRWARRNLIDSFAKVKALEVVGLEGLKDNVKTGAVIAARSDEELPEVSLESAGSLLLTMIDSLFAECFHNPRHGLDCYLSMRVRHGALSGQLRAPLEDEKVITQRKGGSEEYARNEYWLSRLSLSADGASRLDALLRHFARDYDELIREFASTKVQIRSSAKPDALFANDVPKSSIELLAHDFHRETTFEGFLDSCFNTFSQAVENSLECVREYIDKALKPQVNMLFTSLLAESDYITAGIPTPHFDTAIRNAQTRTQQALDVVKDWFRQVNPPPPRIFSLEEIIQIGLQQVKKRSFGFEPELTCVIAELPQFADLARFSDIFVILFENVARHSGHVNEPWVEIKASLDDPFLILSFANNISLEVITADAETNLERIRSIIDEGAFHSGIRSEGGTGLIKLANILGVGDRGTSSKLNFGFRDDGTFYVEMLLPIRIFEMDDLEGERGESITSRGR